MSSGNANPGGISSGKIALLIAAITLGITLAKLYSAQRLYEPSYHRAPGEPPGSRSAWPTSRPRPMPTFSSNDRSRWATVRALVDDGTFVVGTRDPKIYVITGVTQVLQTDVWNALPQVAVGLSARISSSKGICFEDGWQTVDLVLHPNDLQFYSTKPPLLSFLVAGEYWVIKKLTGWNLRDNPFGVVRLVLFTINTLPFLLYLYLIWKLICSFTTSELAQIFVFTVASLGTIVLPFLNTLNNHSMAVFSVLFAVYCLVRIMEREKAEELGHWGGGLWFMAMGLCSGFAVVNELPALAFLGLACAILLFQFPRQTFVFFIPMALIPIAGLLWVNYLALGQFRPAYSEFGGPWYTYEGSHWRVFPGMVRRGIDWAGYNGEGKLTYGFHLLFGHHGFFSLTPVFLLSAIAFVVVPFKKNTPQVLKLIVILSAILGVIVIGFYLFKSDNYGGFTVGPRWLMWLVPLFLISMTPVVENWLKSPFLMICLMVLLVFTVMAANYPGWSAWRHPWIYEAMMDAGWSGY